MSESLKKEDATIQALIRLVSAGARGEALHSMDIDWQTVHHLAAEQHVVSLMACGLLLSPELSCPDAFREYLLEAMRAESSANLIRRQRILGLVAELSAAGIQAKVLKGYAVAGCYRYPESRGSVDTDLLIPAQQEQAALRFFQNHGFRVDPRASTSHHTVCQHPRYGMIELHISLYSELIREVWFQNHEDTVTLQEPFLSVQSAEGEFHTLGHTDQLIFLTLHMVKHFILEALTLRMMLDVALFFAAHRSEIDTERFWHILEILHYKKLVSSILWIMVQFGEFQPEDFLGLSAEAPEDTHRILEDMLEGGYLGCNEKAARQESGMEYNRRLQLQEKSQGQYVWYMLIHKLRGSAKLMFPPLEQLKKQYPVTNRYRISIPFVRLYHMMMYTLRKLRSGSLQRDIHSGIGIKSETVKKRMELFRSLDML